MKSISVMMKIILKFYKYWYVYVLKLMKNVQTAHF